MNESVKILPAVMIALAIMFVIKATGFFSTLQGELTGIGQAWAEDQVAEKSVDETDTASADPSAMMASSAAPDDYAPSSSAITNSFMSETEIEVLQSLAARRQELETRANEMDLREKLLMATETRVDGKIAELKAIEDRIKEMLALRNEEEEAQIRSLVKVYETMKAKDAAKIFEQLETDILLDVAGRMKESKIAAIMAAMNPASAQELTVMLATRRELPMEEAFVDEARDGQDSAPETQQDAG